MNVTLSNFVMLATGAAIGSFVAWKLTKKKYDQLIQEEIDSVKEAFGMTTIKQEPEEPKEPEKPADDTPTTYERFSNSLFEYGYKREESSGSTAVIDEDDSIHVIAPEEFGDLENEGYTKVSLTYYVDEILADFYDNVVDDIEHTVGKDFATHFGEYEDDSVFVRNDKKKIDYEILSDLRTYGEAVKDRKRSHQMEVE